MTGSMYGGGDVWRGDVWWSWCMVGMMYGGGDVWRGDVWWGDGVWWG